LGPRYTLLELANEGTQNYTCDPTSLKFTNNTANVTIWDVTAFWEGTKPAIMTSPPPNEDPQGFHIFVTDPRNPSAPPVPEFHAGDDNFLGDVLETAVPPDPAVNVADVLIKGFSGTLATFIVRTNTDGGMPPTSCKAGQETTVPFNTNYLMFT
jgi:Protein of unknown function (DUF3455)